MFFFEIDKKSLRGNLYPMDITRLRRLIEIDASLASVEGLHSRTYCETAGITRRTLTRDLDVLRDLGQEIISRVEGPAGHAGAETRLSYADRRRRVFAGWVSKDG